MILQRLKYNPDDIEWHSVESVPTNKRDILMYVPEHGTTLGFYNPELFSWYDYKWECTSEPICWREIPRYEVKVSFSK